MPADHQTRTDPLVELWSYDGALKQETSINPEFLTAHGEAIWAGRDRIFVAVLTSKPFTLESQTELWALGSGGGGFLKVLGGQLFTFSAPGPWAAALEHLEQLEAGAVEPTGKSRSVGPSQPQR